MKFSVDRRERFQIPRFQLRLVFIDQVTLDRVDDEKTVLRFELDGDGEFVSMNRIEKILTPYRLDPEQLMLDSEQNL